MAYLSKKWNNNSFPFDIEEAIFKFSQTHILKITFPGKEKHILGDN